jgi:hypothetical protein
MKRKKKTIVKVPSMRRFRLYLEREGACTDAKNWLDYRNFKTVREMYEALRARVQELLEYQITSDSRPPNWFCVPGRPDLYCFPEHWLRWLFLHNFGRYVFGGAWKDPYKDVPPPWREVRKEVKMLVDRVVHLDE